MIRQLTYANTNTYLIRGGKAGLLFDTGRPGTFALFCGALRAQHTALREIQYLLISHYHPDHMGIAQEIASHGVTIVVPDVQRAFIHHADDACRAENGGFPPILDRDILPLPLAESRVFLAGLGIRGEILYTPGHSDDSISLWLDEGVALVGDLPPYHEREQYPGTRTVQSWELLSARRPSRICYGHGEASPLTGRPGQKQNKDLYALTARIMKYLDKGVPLDKIRSRTGADEVFLGDVARMYLTHPHVSVQGILDRIEIKDR